MPRLYPLDPALARSLAQRLKKLPGVTAEAVESQTSVGGGSLPGQSLTTWVVELTTAQVRTALLS